MNESHECQNTHHSKIWLYINTWSTERTVNSFVCDLHSFLSFTKCSKYLRTPLKPNRWGSRSRWNGNESHQTYSCNSKLELLFFFFIQWSKTYTWLTILFTVNFIFRVCRVTLIKYTIRTLSEYIHLSNYSMLPMD